MSDIFARAKIPCIPEHKAQSQMPPKLQSLIHKAKEFDSWVTKDFLGEQFQDHDSALKQLAKAHKSGDAPTLNAAWKRVLRSRSGKRLAILMSRNAKNWPKSLEQLDTEIQVLGFNKLCGEPVNLEVLTKTGFSAILRNKPKKLGYRLIHQYGWMNSARALLLRDALRVVLPTHESDAQQTGRGPEYFARWVKHKLETNAEWVLLIDISNFYGSVRGNAWIEEVTGLKGGIIERELFTHSNANLSLSGIYKERHHLLEAARCGLPQGKATSQTIASYLYGTIMDEVCPKARCLFHGDDGLILAGSKSEAEAIAQSLRGILASHRAGPFSLKRCDIFHKSQGFEIMKYYHKKLMGKPAICDPGFISIDRLQERVAVRVFDLGGHPYTGEAIECYAQNWKLSFPEAKFGGGVVEMVWHAVNEGISLGEDILDSQLHN